MYADRYTGESRFHPAGLVAAVGINVGLVAALMVAAPHLGIVDPPDPITIYPVPADPPPPEPRPQPRQRSERAAETPDAPTPRIATPMSDDRPTVFDPIPWQDGVDVGGTPDGTGSLPADPPAPPPPLPVIVAPSVDPRFAADLQPAYPPSEQRLGQDGRVTVRVLIGPDGRVQRVERLSATSDAFFAATEAQALRRWRFRPGTRDGVAQQAWRTMTVTFRLED